MIQPVEWDVPYSQIDVVAGGKCVQKLYNNTMINFNEECKNIFCQFAESLMSTKRYR